jgi:hypothetical protein
VDAVTEMGGQILSSILRFLGDSVFGFRGTGVFRSVTTLPAGVADTFWFMGVLWCRAKLLVVAAVGRVSFCKSGSGAQFIKLRTCVA